MPLAGMREEVSHCVSSDLEAWWSLTRGFDLPTHMLVISFSVRMLNGIQRITSDLRPATSFHLVLVKIGTSLQDWPVIQTRSDRLRAARSYPSGTSVLFKIKLVLAEPAGTCSVTAVPASRIPTKCVGIVNSCDDSGALMLSLKLSPQSWSSV